VPTWNYIAVHAYGMARMLDDAQLMNHIQCLTAAYEPPTPGGWSTERIPSEVTGKLLQSIVGFEIEITRIEGKWKLGQNRSAEDSRGAIRGLRERGDAESLEVAAAMDCIADRTEA
jgi:transcriptional regulator